MTGIKSANVRVVCPGCGRPAEEIETIATGAHHRVVADDGRAFDLPVRVTRCAAPGCTGHFHLAPLPCGDPSPANA